MAKIISWKRGSLLNISIVRVHLKFLGANGIRIDPERKNGNETCRASDAPNDHTDLDV